MDLEKMVNESLAELVKKGTIKEMVDTHVLSMIDSVLKNEIGKHSDFSRSITTVVRESLKIPQQLDLQPYTSMIVDTIKRIVDTKAPTLLQEQIAKVLEELLAPAPESIKFSDLVAQYIQHLVQTTTGDCSCEEAQERTIDVKVKQDSGSLSSFKYLHLHPEPLKPFSGSADIVLGFYNDKMFSVRMHGLDMQKELFAGPFYGFERTLFQMKVMGTKIIWDKREDDIEKTYTPAE